MPKIILPENIQKLKEQIETGNNLVDYFFICGVSPSICMNEEIYNISDEESIDNINKLLKPSILCKFPEFDKINDIVDDELIRYCFPEGFRIKKNDSYEPNRKIFSIILDNNILSQDYPQKYLTCILFYEKLYQYKTLQQQIEKIENNKEYFTENTENITLNNMRSTLEEEKKLNIYRHQKMVTSSILPSMMKRAIKIGEDDIKKINNEKPKNYIDINEEKTKENKNQPLNKLKHYYIPKCICLLSIHPHIKLYQKILSNIYNYGISQNNDIPLEKIITNLIIEVPVPPRGMYSIYYNYNYNIKEEKIEKKDFNLLNNINNNNFPQINLRTATQYKNLEPSFIDENQVQPLQSTENNKILISGIDLYKFNTNLSFSCKMETIKHILFNTKILFFSLNLTSLIETISAFLSLIFPFKYPFQVASFLQKNNYRILESVSPFMLGINEEFHESFFEENEITFEQTNFFVVDLDKSDEKNYYLFSEEEFPDFPYKLMTNLEKELKNLENSVKNNRESIILSKEKRIKNFNEKYQEKFFIFFCEILKGYEEYLNRDFFNNDFVSIVTLFNCPQFVKCSYHYQSDYPFYTKFVEESQLFQDFIFKNMIPKNNNELMDILIVNNYLNPIKKKKTKVDEQDGYTIKNKYIVPRPKEISDNEKSKIMSDILNLSKKGQIIKNLKYKSDKENTTNIAFDYTLFPVLDFNIYCNNDNVNQYIPPPDYREEIEVLNMEAISKSSLGKNINRAMEMKNYLYLTWLEIWAFTFGNNDFGEKHYRFDQMLDVLDKVIHHEMNILNLMFDILNKYDEHEMMLKLYQKLLQLKLNPSTSIFDIMTKIVDKNKMKDMLDETKKNTNTLKQLKFNDYNKKNNRERTFLSINDNLPLETKPKFYYDYYCLNIECSKKINLYNVSKNFEGIRNDILWVKCNYCGEYNLPKITVKFGLNFITKSTSIEEYVLHSPYNLKINIKQAVYTKFGSDMKNTKFKLPISNFKSQFQPLFWDFIWYCIIHDLDYNILLPYSKTLEEEKKAHCFNPNINLFEVIYDDSTYKDNQTKIEKISNTIIKRSSEDNKNKNFKILEQCNKVIEIQLKSKNKKNILKEKNEIIEEEDDGNNSVDYKENEEEHDDKNDLENNIMNNMEMNMNDIMVDNNENNNEEDNEEDNEDNEDNEENKNNNEIK